MATPNKKASFTVKRYYRPAFVKTIAQCRLKILVDVSQRPMSAIVFSIQSLNNIWMMSISDENHETGQIQAKGPSGEGRRPKWRRTKPPSGEG